MTKKDLAFELTINYLTSEEIYVDPFLIKEKIKKWNELVPTIDFISLAALAMADPNEYDFSVSEIRKISEFFFPSKNYIERSLF